MKLEIEVKKIEDLGVYEAVLVGEDVEASCKDKFPLLASQRLMNFLKSLGYKGGFNVHTVIEYEGEEETETETMKIASKSRIGVDHEVSFNPDHDPAYQCTCEHFIYRVLPEGKNENCKHINTAIGRGLGLELSSW